MRFTKTLFIILTSVLLVSCFNKGNENAKEKTNSVNNVPCNLKVAISGEAEEVSFNVYVKSKEKSVTVDRKINLKTDQNSYDFNIHSNAKIHIQVKTFDSYGPNVNVQVFLNDQLWLDKSDSYIIDINTVVPNPVML